MDQVLRRNKQETQDDLIKAINKFNPLLEKQGETEAVADLNLVCQWLQEGKVNEAIQLIFESFDDKHELIAYTLFRKKNDGGWSEAEELSNASSRVFSLAKRLEAV